MAKHGDVTAGGVHIPYNWTYANQAAREGAGGFGAGDVGKLALQADSNDLYILTATTPTWSAIGGAGGTAIYPTRTTMWHDEATATVGTAIVPSYMPNQNYIISSSQASGGNGDTFTQSFMLAAGTYSFSVLGMTYHNSGLLDWYIDDVKVISLQDWYAASTGTKNVVKTVGSITVTGDGRHVLKCTINGKNASADGYYAQLTKYWFTPATDTTSV